MCFRDAVELISNHLEIFRRNQSAIGGAKKISTLSCEQIDEALKYYMSERGELHPAIRSPECEYKVCLKWSDSSLIYCTCDMPYILVPWLLFDSSTLPLLSSGPSTSRWRSFDCSFRTKGSTISTC